MRLVQRKSESDRLLETVSNSLGAVTGGVNRGKLVKAGLVAGGLAALTAGSAAISSIRRRMDGNDS
jgi:TRAP-type mannitol/chloroaromatic compound transport system permease large subunit